MLNVPCYCHVSWTLYPNLSPTFAIVLSGLIFLAVGWIDIDCFCMEILSYVLLGVFRVKSTAIPKSYFSANSSSSLFSTRTQAISQKVSNPTPIHYSKPRSTSIYFIILVY